jgi:TRAP-type uncharacterized transport system fused permease subunit
LPFLFIARPELLGLETSISVQLVTAALAGVALVAINVAIEGLLVYRLRLYERVMLLPAAFCLFHHSWWTTIVGLALFALVIGRQVSRAQAPSPRPEPSDV